MKLTETSKCLIIKRWRIKLLVSLCEKQKLFSNSPRWGSQSRSVLLTQCSSLQQTLACSILTALLSEFSSSSKTSSIGLSMEFHGNCKRLFQVCLPRWYVLKPPVFFIHPKPRNQIPDLSSLPGGRSASDLHVDYGTAAGVQSQGKPQRSDVLCLPALPGSCQPGPELELPASKSYP